MFAVVVVATAVVVTAKLAVEEPARTVTGDDTVADPLSLDTVTLVLLAAFPLSVTVQVVPVGGVTLDGLQLTPDRTIAGVKVSPKVLVVPFRDALIVAVVVLPTLDVVTLKFAVEDPAFTVTGDDTVAAPLLLDTVTLMLLGALPLSVMVQVEPVGGVTLPGEQLRFVRVGTGGSNVTEEVLLVPFKEAVMVAVVLLETAVVVTLKLAVEDPEFTVTGDATMAFPELLDTVTLVLLGALPLSVMVQLKPVGGVTLPGEQLRLDRLTAAGSRVTEDVWFVPFRLAVMVAVVLLETAVVVTLKLAVDAPAFTVTGVGATAFPELLDTVTFMLLRALPLSVMVQLKPVGGVTLPGVQLRFVSVGAGGSKVRANDLFTPFHEAEMFAVVVVATAVVVTAKLAVEEPARTVTGDDTVADPLSLDTVTLVLLAAFPLRVTVQVVPVGGVTLDGLQLTPDRTIAGVKVSPKVLVVPFRDALIVAVVVLPTLDVVTLKFAVEDPAFTVTGDDTVAAPLLLDTVTLMLLGALPLSVMVQVEPVGGVTLPGEQLRFVRVGTGGSNVTEEVLLVPFKEAVMVAVVLLETAVVVTLKLAVEEPEFTVTGEATTAFPELLDTVTLVLLGALPLSVMVQLKPVGGVTLPGEQFKFVRLGTGGSKVTDDVCDVPFNVAVIVTRVLLLTAVVVALKLAVEDPEFTVTGEVTTALAELLDTVTLVLLGALPLSVMVQLKPVGGVTLPGEQFKFVSVGTGGSNVTEDVLLVPFKEAVMVAVVLLETAVVVTLKLAVEEPEFTVTGDATMAFPELLDTVTLVLLGALPLSVMVQLKPVGGVTLPGEQLRFVRVGTGGSNVTEEVLLVPFKEAVMVAVVLLETAVVVTLKLAVEDPEFTVTGDATMAFPELLDTVTLVLLGALPLSVMVQLKPVGGVTLPGEQLRLDRVTAAGSRVTEDVWFVPFRLAVMVAVVLLETAVVVTLKLAVDAPAFTVTGVGATAFPELLDTVTFMLLRALPLSVMVQLKPVGGVTLPGVQLRFVSVGAGGSKVRANDLFTPFHEAEMFAVVVVATAVVVTAKLAVEEPARTVTGDDTVADPLSLDTVTLVLLAAFPLRVTVQVVPVGGVTLDGLQLTPDRTIAGVKVSPKVSVVPFRDALIVAVVVLPTLDVVTLRFAGEDPAFTVTGDDTVAAPLLLDTVTLMLLGALPLSVMVQVEPVGGVTLPGEQLRFVRVGTGGSNVTEEVLLVPFKEAVMVAVVLLETAVVVTLKLAVEEPEFTVTGEATTAFPELLDTVTLVLLGALPLSVMVQLKPVGGVTLPGEQFKFVRLGTGGSKVTDDVCDVPFNVAVIVTRVLLLTAVVVALKLAVEDPEFTVTGEVTTALAELLDTVTLVLLGALPLSVMVQLKPVGGVTLPGEQFKFVSVGTGGSNVTEDVLLVPFKEAVMVAVVLLETAVVVTLKLAVEEPEFTVTGDATMAFPELLDTVTLVLLGALPLSVMVQLKPVGGVTLPGEQLRFVRVGTGGSNVTEEVLLVPFKEAVMVAVVLLETAVVVTLKLAVEDPEFTVTGDATM